MTIDWRPTMRRLLFSAGIVPFMLSAALAQSDPAADLQKADKALNETFRQIERRLAQDPAGKERLIKAQRAWIEYRDAEYTSQSSGEDVGSAAPMVAAACKANLT